MAETRAAELVEEYVRLGGRRLGKLDDNKVTIRQWEDDTPEAEAFWQKNIAHLEIRQQEEIITLLPSMNAH